METSPLPVKGCKFWPLLGTHGYWAVRILYTYYDAGHPFIMVISEDPLYSHLLIVMRVQECRRELCVGDCTSWKVTGEGILTNLWLSVKWKDNANFMMQREWKPEQWQQVIFFDKTQVVIGQNNSVSLWRISSEKWKPYCLNQRKTLSNDSWFFWVCFWVLCQ